MQTKTDITKEKDASLLKYNKMKAEQPDSNLMEAERKYQEILDYLLKISP